MTRRRNTDHTDYCARDHRCNLAEHRSPEIVVYLPGYGRAALVRVRTDDGREQAEIRVRVALATTETTARRQLACLLAGLRQLVTRVAVTGRPRPGRRRTA